VAVLNACKSAVSDSGIAANLSLELLRCGVSTVIGMSYKLLTRAADIFTRHFYESLLVKGTDILTSTWEARRALREDRSRQAPFGLNVDVDDSIVPVFYTRHALAQSPSSDPGLGLGGLPKIPPAEWDSAKDASDIESTAIVGREFDALHLENSLIANKGFLHLFGHIGVGKTALLDDAISWWRTTKYVRSYVAVDISEFLNQSLPTVLDRLRNKVKELSGIDQHSNAYPSPTKVEKKSKVPGSTNDNILIVIDQAEDYLRVLDDDKRSGFLKTLRQFHNDINQQHPTLMIIASCCKMKKQFSKPSIISLVYSLN
jgi:CHAT domain